MRDYDFRIQKIYRLQPGSSPQPWAYEVDTLPLSHRADFCNIQVVSTAYCGPWPSQEAFFGQPSTKFLVLKTDLFLDHPS
ncbi:hypothetical protein TNCV_1730021 [Trichonephila clavipes]|nr:hypothetical protein TNCV_1730021 [Trichonephila clavipes]